jgi:hypothetical protein
MKPYLLGTGLFLFFTIASVRIWGWEMIVDILLSPVRRYDFDEEDKKDESD